MDWSGPLARMSWSPDSRWIAVANSFGTADRGIVLVSPATGARVEWHGLSPTLTAAVPMPRSSGSTCSTRTLRNHRKFVHVRKFGDLLS